MKFNTFRLLFSENIRPHQDKPLHTNAADRPMRKPLLIHWF